jgi:hypothetical protein
MTEQPSQAGQEPPEGTNAPIPAAPAKGGLGTGAKVGLLVAGAVALVAISGIGGYAIGQSIGSSKEHATSHWQPWESGELWRPDKDHRHHKSGPHHKDHRDGYQDDWNDGQGMGPDESGPGWDAPPTPEGPAGPPEPGPSPQS